MSSGLPLDTSLADRGQAGLGTPIVGGANSVGTALKGARTKFRTEGSQSFPRMVSNTSPAGHQITASSFFQSSASYSPYYAFDSNGNTEWAANGSAGEWIMRRFPQPVRIGEFSFWQRNNVPIYNWLFQASNNGLSFVNLFYGTVQLTGQRWQILEGIRGYYQFYRFFVLSSANTVGLRHSELYQDFPA